jgi:hypothetical protein
MKKQILFLMLLLYFIIAGKMTAQNVAINNSGTSPNPSAMLDVSATDKGVLIPRLTSSQRIGIASPANGLLVYDSETQSFWYFTEAPGKS